MGNKITVILVLFISTIVSFVVSGEITSQFKEVELSSIKPFEPICKAELTSYEDKDKGEFQVINYTDDNQTIIFESICLTKKQKKELEQSLVYPEKYSCFMIITDTQPRTIRYFVLEKAQWIHKSKFRDVELTVIKPDFFYSAVLTTYEDKNNREFQTIDYSYGNKKIKFEYACLTSQQKQVLQQSLNSPEKHPCFMTMINKKKTKIRHVVLEKAIWRAKFSRQPVIEKLPRRNMMKILYPVLCCLVIYMFIMQSY